jgi:hypothetical protein
MYGINNIKFIYWNNYGVDFVFEIYTDTKLMFLSARSWKISSLVISGGMMLWLGLNPCLWYWLVHLIRGKQKDRLTYATQ